ncbi:MAG: GNAT family N-acetyltransferase, partial [Fretibacterium sp.]|nr:GNAT family N-acetyltransferase [Fretibacterium sp.]
RIESERLFLYPISDKEMRSLVENEKDTGLKQAYLEMLRGCVQEPENRIWYTLWAIELKSKPGTIIGDFCFKGLNTNGMVEIGYGLREGYCGHGYMTEAVKRISQWALTQNGVTRVESETAPENEASQKVLLHAGFVPTGKNGEEGPRFLYH